MNLIEGLHEEMNRVRDLIKIYEDIPMGFIGASIMKQSIKTAEKAIQDGDVIAELQAYELLKSHE